MSKRFIPTAEQRSNVEAMIGYGIPEDEICRLIKNPETGKPIDGKTLRQHFAVEIRTGQTKANAKVGDFIFSSIMGTKGGVENERARAHLAMFWADRRMGWKRTNVQEHTLAVIPPENYRTWAREQIREAFGLPPLTIEHQASEE